MNQNDSKQSQFISIFPMLLLCCMLFCLVAAAPAQEFQAGVKKFKDQPPVLHDALVKAESFASKGQFREAKKYLESFTIDHPIIKHSLLFYELGYFCYQLGETEKTIGYLRKTVELTPDYKDGWQLLALAYQSLGNTIEGESKKDKQKRIEALQNGARAMGHAVRLSGDKDLLYQSAILWLEGEKPKKALGVLEKLCSKPSPRQEWLVGLADTLKALKRYEETAEAMEKAARVQNNSELLFHAAWLWNDLEKPKRALALLQTLVEKKKVDKNWLLLLVGVYSTLQQPGNAATTLERVIETDPAPDFLFNCGLLWLQDNKHDNALRSLLRLDDVQPPKADWFVATAQAWLFKENIVKAADSMVRAALLSNNPDYIYRAGVLRIQLKEADRAITLLTPLADHKKPKSEWLVALANGWLHKENYLNGARYMERAAIISDQGKLYHRAAMLWRFEERLGKCVELLKKSVARETVEQLWLVDLASAFIDTNREKKASAVMARTRLGAKTVSNQLRYRGAVIWLNLQKPDLAYPLLKQLSRYNDLKYSWMNSMVKTCVELERTEEAAETLARTLNLFPNQVKAWKLSVWFSLQQSDYVGATAAKEVVRRFEPDVEKHLKDLSRLYLLAGVPHQSARTFTKTIGSKPTPDELDQLVDIYLSGQMYNKALRSALELAQKTNVADHWESLGDIYYVLRRYPDSCNAYEKAAVMNQAPEVVVKAAYAAMKDDQFEQATQYFEKVISLCREENQMVDSAMQNLAFIRKRKEKIESLQN